MTLLRSLQGASTRIQLAHRTKFNLPATSCGSPCQAMRTPLPLPRRFQLTSPTVPVQVRVQYLHTHLFTPKSSAKIICCNLIPASHRVRGHQALAVMTSITQTRLHVGHSHSHSHHHDNTYLTSTNKKDAGVRITRIGLYVNLVMAVGKGVGGYVFHSQALVADAFHSLTDLVSDFMTLGTVSWSLKPPSARFPSGYGKIESLGSLGVSSLLLVGGILMGLNACEILYHEFFADVAASGGHSHGGIFGHSHSHSHNSADLGPNINAAWLAAGSIVVKEYLYRASEFQLRCPRSIY